MSINVLLPLSEKSVNSPAMVRHCVKIVKPLFSKLILGQFNVITGDQPVYTLGKQIQWKHTDECKDVLWMMGPFHIEMAFISAIGNWLEGSGWVEIFERGSDFTLARVESFLYGNKVKRCRYGHQVSLAAFRKLAGDAFRLETEGSQVIISFTDWADKKKSTSVTAHYWFQLMSLKIILFMFVRSFREANFDMFVCCLKAIVPRLLSLDHVHYASWLPIFIRD